VTLVKLHVPFEAAGANVYAIGNLHSADRLEEVGGALRAEWAVGSTEVSATAAARKDQPLRLGGDVSTGIWVLDLHLEGAVQHGVTAPFWEGTLDLETLEFATEVDRSEDWIPQVAGGAEVSLKYNDEDVLYLGAEGFWNDAGYADATLYDWLLYEGQFTPFYLGQTYVGAYAFVPSPGQLDDASFTASVLTNLSDGSALARVDTRVLVLTYINVNAYAAIHFGEPGEFRFGLDIPPMPGLEEGLVVPPSLVDAGIAATVSF
jgi:hypothetical protein